MKNDVYEIIGNLANALAKTGDTIKASGVADFLNHNNHKTTNNTSYSPDERGIYTVIRYAYDYFMKKGDNTTATNVASSITDKNGKFPWKK
jgi:hypothetical protein